MPKSALHILALRKHLLDNKPYLKRLKNSKSTQRRIHLLKQSTQQQLRTLQLLLVAFVQGEIAISSSRFKKLKRSRKLNLLLTHFKSAKLRPAAKDHILQLASVLPLLLKVVLR